MALAASVILHLLAYGTYKGGQWLGLWEQLHWRSPVSQVEDPEAIQDMNRFTQSEPPLMFVDVNPSVETPEAPEDSKYYSDKNSRAANPLTDTESNIPEFTGSQDKLVRTETVPPPAKAVPLQPALPEPAPVVEAPPEEAPQEASDPQKGDLLLAKAPEPRKPREPIPSQAKPRPRTLKEARARLPQPEVDKLVGEQMKQDGGVRRLATLSSLDVRASPFGEYDKAIILAIQNRWFDQLDRRGFSHERSGKVTVEFRLHYDGRVSRLLVTENTVDQMLSLFCQKAIKDPSPYARWPSDMRRMIGANYRDVKFTFYYN